MKKTVIILAALLALSVNAFAETAAASAPDQVATLTKERDEARAQLAAVQTQAQQNQIVTEYYKAVAEKNQTILELVGARQQIEALNRDNADLRAKLEAATKKPTEAAK